MYYDVGDTASLDQFRVLLAGVLTDATVVVTVTKPDGTTTAPTPVHTATGLYDATVTVDQAGVWTWVWTASGAVTSKETGQFTAIAPRVLVADFAEFKAHLNRTDLTDDAELRTYLVAATDWVERTIGGPLSVQTFTESVPVSGWWITPSQRPLVSVTSLTPELGALLDPSAYVVDTLRGAIRIRWGAFTGWYTLVYKAGYAVIQERHKLAGLIVAAHLWQIQNGGGGMPFPGDSDVPQFGQGYAIPNRAKELLAPDRIPGFA
jgi:hypothetical protein